MNELTEDNIIFVNKIMGFKGVAYNDSMLIVNDFPNNKLSVTYNINNETTTTDIPYSTIKNISSSPNVRMSNTPKKAETHEVQSILISAALFGGSPLIQLAGAGAINNLFETVSNNYNKVNYNTIHEITIELNNEENTELVFSTEINPEKFIGLVNEHRLNDSE